MGGNFLTGGDGEDGMGERLLSLNCLEREWLGEGEGFTKTLNTSTYNVPDKPNSPSIDSFGVDEQSCTLFLFQKMSEGVML